jgi:hypothetical protein
MGRPVTAQPTPGGDSDVERLAETLRRHEWEPAWPKTAHAEHQFHGMCAVCQGDLPRILAVALAAARPVAPPPAPTDLREAVARWVFALNNPARLFDTLSGLAGDAREAAAEVLRLTQAAQDAAVAEAEQRGRREALEEAADLLDTIAAAVRNREGALDAMLFVAAQDVRRLAAGGQP